MPAAPHETILLVEDERQLRFVLTTHLRAVGYAVCEATDGLAAIEAAKQEQPDLIIMDVGLPKLDGISATRALKGDPATSSIPIIMLTARSGSADVVRGLEAGAQEYLAKPFDITELIARVHTVLKLSAARQELDELNTALEAEVDEKTRRLQILYDFMRDLNRASDQDAVLALVIESVEKLTHAKRISILLKDGEGERLVHGRSIGIDPSVADSITLGSDEGFAGGVYSTGKMLTAKTYSVSGEGEPFLSAPLVSTSLQTDDGVLGVLNVTEKQDNSGFGEEEIECVRSIADAAAIALNNIQRQHRLKESVKILLQTVGHLAEYRDEETTRHLERVAVMARILAEQLSRSGPYAGEITDEFVELLVQAAPMHDIGKVGIPDDILTKPGKLTDEEFQIMKTHTDIGRRVLSKALDPANPVPLLRLCIDIAYCHHERFNGTGYPRRLKGHAIPLAARIIALVDAYDAITSERRYKKAKPHEQAVAIISAESGAHFDPAIVDGFLQCHDRFSEVRERLSEPSPLNAAQR
ncbi:MAG: HD domain-containing phosphohydrolase [Phycisphaerae bacterium]